MENKKLKILIVFVVLILTGTAFLIMSKTKNVFPDNFKSSKNQSEALSDRNKQNQESNPGSISDLKCQNDWQEYRQDVLGIAFCYPADWGTPNTDPIKNVTRISNMEETFETQNIYYENALNINFERNNQIHIRLFNDQYSGKSQRDINEPDVYYESGTTDDIVSLKNGSSICDYKIGYDYKYNPQMKTANLKTIYSDCANGVKLALTQNKEFFDFDNTGTLFTYDLRLLSFKKLTNNHFDNVLISRTIDQANQIHEELGTLDEFFDGNKTTKVENGIPTKTKEQLDQERKEFEQFTNTITAFKPVSKIQTDFEKISGEDPNVTTIRKYYWLIASGKLDEAYSMYFDKGNVAIDKFKERYGNAYSAEPFDFKSAGKNRYELHVKYQDNNSSTKEFRVTMDVFGNMVKTIFLEEYVTDVAKFGSMTAYSARRGNKNYVFLNKDGKEIVVDQGDAQYDGEYKNMSYVKHFSDPQFSPKGNYLVYTMSGWEWSVTYVYSIKDTRRILDLPAANNFGFSKDEKNFFSCTNSDFGGERYANVYSVPDFSEIANLLLNKDTEGSHSISCKLNDEDKTVNFEFKDYWNDDGSDNNKILNLKFDLEAKKVK